MILILLMSYCGYSGRQVNSSESESSRASVAEAELTQQQRFNQILVQADQLVQKQQIQAAISKLRLLMQKINFLRQTKKQYDRKLQLVCIYNLAAAYQKQWSLNDCIPLLQKFIALVKVSLQESLKASGSLGMQEAGGSKHWFKLKTVMIRALLQYCAVLSQIGEHKKALRTAMDITNELKGLFRRGLEECGRQIAKREAAQAKKGAGKEGKAGVDKIEFSFSVLLSARQALQELVRMQTYSEITDSEVIQSEMQEVKSKIFFWKSNPENNIKTLRQSFGSVSEQPQEVKRTNDRNLLGIKRSQGWVQQFTIAKVMFMSPLNYLEFSDNDNLIFEFNHRNLVEKIILLSVTYFSISIELRFLEEEGQGERKRGKGEKRREVEGSRKELQKSQILHLKSIEMVCKHIKENSAFVSHLVVNYHKHYKNNLNTIEEQNSLAEYSQLYDVKKSRSEEETLKDSTDTLVLPMNNVYRKDSVYYQQEIEEDEDKRPKKQREGKSKEMKQQEPVFAFKKPYKKHITQSNEQKSQRSNKLGSSTSFNRHQEIGQKDKTMKKVGSSKMITLSKFQLQQLERNDKSQKSISYKQISSRSIKDKSLSKSKNFLKNSITLKQNKSSSPLKDRNSKCKGIRDLKESGQMRRDFGKKKSPQPSKALDLLKKSGSLQDFTGKGLKQSGHMYNSPNTLHLKKKH